MRRRSLTLVFAIAAVAAVAAARPAMRAYEAVLVLAELVGRPVPAWADARPQAARRAATYERAGRRRQADLYKTDGRSRAGIVFVPGAVRDGKDDPRVVAFATSLARCGFAVLVPDIVALRELRLLPGSAVDVEDALAWMESRPDLAPSGRLGMLTTSVGIGPALIAVLDDPSGRDVRFFVSIGGYYDLPRTLTYLTTGSYDADGVTRRDLPNDYGKWIYALSNAARLQDPAERAEFETLARRKLADPNADVTEEIGRLGPAGHAAYAYIVNHDPARSRALLDEMPAYLHADVDQLDLAARDLSGVGARFILVHGKDDDMIPYGESVGLAAALPPNRTQLFVLNGFKHVETESGLIDGFHLWRAIYALLAER